MLERKCIKKRFLSLRKDIFSRIEKSCRKNARKTISCRKNALKQKLLKSCSKGQKLPKSCRATCVKAYILLWMSVQINKRSHKTIGQQRKAFKKRNLKWWDILDAVYKIKKVGHRRGKFGNSAILTLETKNGDDFRVWAPKRLAEDLLEDDSS